MALAIATNNAALNAAASASSVNRDMETSMARLSTGKRINSASDDAAGVAISSRLSAEIRGTDQAIRNSLDGQALIDTAEGAHKEIENILQRMREVSVQAANDTNNDQDRANLQAEMDAMITEIDRIAGTTTWAGANLMQDEAGTPFSFQVGAATGDKNQININIDGMGSNILGLATSTDEGGQQPAASATLDDVSVSSSGFQAMIPGTELTPANPAVDVAAITGAADLFQGAAFSTPGIVQLNNGLQQATMIIPEQSPSTPPVPVEVAINLTDAASINQSVTDINAALVTAGYDLANITAEVGTTGAPNGDGDNGLLIMTGTVPGITFAADETNSTANATVDAGTGHVTFSGSTSAVLSFTDASAPPLGVSLGAIDPADLSAAVTAINAATGTHGLVAEIISVDDGNGGVVGELHLRTADIPADVANITNQYDLSTVTSDRTGNIIEISPFVAAGSIAEATYAGGTPEVAATFDGTLDTSNGLFTPAADKTEITISLGDTDVVVTGLTGDGSQADAQIIADAINSGTDGHKFTASTNDIPAGTVTITAGEQSVPDAPRTLVSDGTIARASIIVIDEAIKTVNIQRSKLGAVSNRLNHTVNNLTNISSNLSAAKGGIEDADFALETTNLAKNQILQQASTAMLAQANASKQNVLSLLQG
jgi:flagellin